MSAWKKWSLIAAAVGALLVLALTVPAVRHVLLAPSDMVQAVSTGMEFRRLETMIEGFSKEYKRWPTEDEFHELVNQSIEADRGDSLKSNGLVDRWGEPYNYFRQGSGYVITSMGPDRRPGSKDDIILLKRK